MNSNAVIKADKNSLRYAIVEMLFGDEKNNVITKGLFRGINEENNTRFVILEVRVKGKPTFQILNPELYNIMSIEVYDGCEKTYLYFRAESKDQRIAMKCLYDTLDLMEHFTEGDEKNIIDTSKYTDVPKCMGIESSPSPSVVKPVNNPTTHKQVNCGNVGGLYGSSRFSNYSVKKDPTPTAFSRKTKKPTEDMLKELRRKMELIAKGKYEYELPVAKGDLEKKREEVTKTTTIDDDDYSYMSEMNY